ncbi:spore germination protein [Virgibacillus sp. 179-BFC.A HS]|uniref:Spore germination protein n=1 Tax=Tigheibacillus jepli TaxID=3035914 RepID=A0ABU5CD66_9BACI|nr:spore germination protein [Virgibacillus sp. 179-BFC.A HS]MDY0404244.1 spore germination protein [Virgibacillus sp. 179-BFC.A HS]
MPYAINIMNVKTNAFINNSNFNNGLNIQNSHTSALKFVGANFAYGDISPAFSTHGSGNFDPDGSDQSQFANPSAPFAGQF